MIVSRYLLFSLCLLATPIHAVELYGLALAEANRQSFSGVLQKAGVKPIREGGEENFYDIYDSSFALEGSQHLFVGYVKADQRFAFAEYEFPGFFETDMLDRLQFKYGPPQVDKGKFISDTTYRWRKDGIEITYGTDWDDYKTRLIYAEPQALIALKAEKKALAQQTRDAKMKAQNHAF